MVTIRGGKDGKIASVSKENRLQTLAQTYPIIMGESVNHGAVYYVNLPRKTVTTTDGMMLYYQNNGEKNIIFDRINVCWNGGTTTGNKCVYLRAEVAYTSAPDTNISALTPYNLNGNYAGASNLTVYGWDEVGTGMTGHAGGAEVGSHILAKGRTTIESKGAFVIPPGTKVAFWLQAEEEGEATIEMVWIESDLMELKT